MQNFLGMVVVTNTSIRLLVIHSAAFPVDRYNPGPHPSDVSAPHDRIASTANTK
jgi:hypothetical protein